MNNDEKNTDVLSSVDAVQKSAQTATLDSPKAQDKDHPFISLAEVKAKPRPSVKKTPSPTRPENEFAELPLEVDDLLNFEEFVSEDEALPVIEELGQTPSEDEPLPAFEDLEPPPEDDALPVIEDLPPLQESISESEALPVIEDLAPLEEVEDDPLDVFALQDIADPFEVAEAPAETASTARSGDLPRHDREEPSPQKEPEAADIPPSSAAALADSDPATLGATDLAEAMVTDLQGAPADPEERASADLVEQVSAAPKVTEEEGGGEGDPKSHRLGRIALKKLSPTSAPSVPIVSAKPRRRSTGDKSLRWWLRQRDRDRPPIAIDFGSIESRSAAHPESVDIAPSRLGPWLPLVTGWNYTHPQIGQSTLIPKELLWALRSYNRAQLHGFVLQHKGDEISLDSFVEEDGELALWWCYRSRKGEGFVRVADLGELPNLLGLEVGLIEVSPNPDRVGWVALKEPTKAAVPVEVLDEAPAPEPEDEILIKPVDEAELKAALPRRAWCWPEPASQGLITVLWGAHLLYALTIAIRHTHLLALPLFAMVGMVWTILRDWEVLGAKKEGGFKAKDALQAGSSRSWTTRCLLVTAWLHALMIPYSYDTTPIELVIVTALAGTTLASVLLAPLCWRRGADFFSLAGVLVQPGLAMWAGLAINLAAASVIGIIFMIRTEGGFWMTALAVCAGALLGWVRPLSALGAQRLRIGWYTGPLDPAAWWFPASATEAVAKSVGRSDFVTRLSLHGPIIQSTRGADESRFGHLLLRALSGPKSASALESLVVLAPMASANRFTSLLKKRLAGLSVSGYAEDSFKDSALSRLFEGLRGRLEALHRLNTTLEDTDRERLRAWVESIIDAKENLAPIRARWSFHIDQARQLALNFKRQLEKSQDPRDPKEHLDALRHSSVLVLRLLQSPVYWGDRLIKAAPKSRRWLFELVLLIGGFCFCVLVALILRAL